MKKTCSMGLIFILVMILSGCAERYKYYYNAVEKTTGSKYLYLAEKEKTEQARLMYKTELARAGFKTEDAPTVEYVGENGAKFTVNLKNNIDSAAILKMGKGPINEEAVQELMAIRPPENEWLKFFADIINSTPASLIAGGFGGSLLLKEFKDMGTETTTTTSTLESQQTETTNITNTSESQQTETNTTTNTTNYTDAYNNKAQDISTQNSPD